MKKLTTAGATIVLSAMLFVGTAHAADRTHTVTSNDTFWLLSKQYNVSLIELLEANANMNPLNLKIGSTIVIPGNHEIAAKTAAAGSVASTPSQPVIAAANGDMLNYSKKLAVKATAYTSAASENGKWGAVDYFGNKLKVGTVAVDPNMIPLGTKLYIVGYDYSRLPKGGMIATATDIGGSIKGNRIDIFVPGTTQEARKFGIQNVEVYVLD